ncbi:MAG TPA: 2-hydroxyacid dehydrogenase, partial [Afipia sp.]
MSGNKTDILIYGPLKPLVEKGLSAQFATHSCRSAADVEGLAADVAARIRGIAVTGLVPANAGMLARFPKLEIVASFGVGYDHVDA